MAQRRRRQMRPEHGVYGLRDQNTGSRRRHRPRKYVPWMMRFPQKPQDVDTKPARISLVEMQLVNTRCYRFTEAETRSLGCLASYYPHSSRNQRKYLYIRRWAVEIERILCDEGRDLIDDLTAHISKPEFKYIHERQPGYVVFWDKSFTQHCAIPYDNSNEDRCMLCTTLESDTPFNFGR